MKRNSFLKIISLSFLFFAAAGVLFAATAADQAPFWYKLERGKQQFRAGNYGEALLLFENARDEKAQTYEDMRAAVLAILSRPDVRALNDNLTRVLSFVDSGAYEAARRAFDELFFYIPRASLAEKASASLDLFDSLKNYPEAEFWIGEVYRAEGSLAIAVKQYEKALQLAQSAENSPFATEILFKLAQLEKLRGAYNEFERHLQQILAQDQLWSGDKEAFVRNAMQRTLSNNGIDSYLTMYRHKNADAQKAHALLAEYYYQSGRHLRAAEHYLFAWTIAATTIIESYGAQQIEVFTFNSLAAVTGSLARYPMISAYMDETEFYKTSYYLAMSLYGAGRESAARSLWAYLAGESAAGEWRTRARRQSQNPQLDAPVPAP